MIQLSRAYPALLAVLLAVAACDARAPGSPARVASVHDDDDAPLNYCAKFPPDATGDDHADLAECEPLAGDQTAYCHLHTGGPDGDGCADLPGGPSPQLHCLAPGDGEDGGNILPVFGGGLDCEGAAARLVARAIATDGPAAFARIAQEDDDAPACDEDHDGVEVTITFPEPEEDASCGCCVIPLTGNEDPNADCDDPDVECGNVYYGEGCGLPALSDEATATLCEALDDGLACMQKPCKYEDNQHCLNDAGIYVPCNDEEATCCQFQTGGMAEVTHRTCREHGGADLGAGYEDCFGGPLPDGIVPLSEIDRTHTID